MNESDATFKVLIQATPTWGPDRPKKSDNHANAAFVTEGRWLRSLLTRHNAISINGDRHWQYVTTDPESGCKEFGTGPTHDSRSGGWSESRRTPEQKFLRIAGGYLDARLMTEPKVQLEMIHRDVNGIAKNREVFSQIATQNRIDN